MSNLIEAEQFDTLINGIECDSRIEKTIYVPSLNLTIYGCGSMHKPSGSFRPYCTEANSLKRKWMHEHRFDDYSVEELKQVMYDEHIKHVKKIMVNIDDIKKLEECEKKNIELKKQIEQMQAEKEQIQAEKEQIFKSIINKMTNN